jgi:hypothetical protein
MKRMHIHSTNVWQSISAQRTHDWHCMGRSAADLMGAGMCEKNLRSIPLSFPTKWGSLNLCQKKEMNPKMKWSKRSTWLWQTVCLIWFSLYSQVTLVVQVTSHFKHGNSPGEKMDASGSQPLCRVLAESISFPIHPSSLSSVASKSSRCQRGNESIYGSFSPVLIWSWAWTQGSLARTFLPSHIEASGQNFRPRPHSQTH